MRDDILKFRKLCEVLRKEKKRSTASIAAEMKLSVTTVMRLMNEDIAEIRIRASVLGIVQDFLHKHCDDLNYAGIECEKPKKEKQEIERRKEWEHSAGEHVPGDMPGFSNASDWVPLKGTVEPSETLKNFFEALGKAIPPNMTMTITINGK